ncbi:hypothetical protein ACLB2K_005801 [Fragaria x ananassa]
MQRCSSTSSQGHVMGSCSCGLFHTQTNSSFSMLFSMPNNHHKPYDQYEPSDHHHMYSFASPSSVDCTLSLGTPSTRLTSDDGNDDKRGGRHERRSVSNFCWDLLQPKHASSSPKNGSGNRGGGGNSDSLLARRCANCDTTSTPLWRNGPRGPKSLCNACGIRFKKEERRATAAAATSANGATSSGSHSWMNNSQAQKMHCYAPSMNGNEFRFMEDHDMMTSHEPADATAAGIPFLSWRLNVTDRPSLVHDFTR